jgi:hypothetical protein
MRRGYKHSILLSLVTIFYCLLFLLLVRLHPLLFYSTPFFSLPRPFPFHISLPSFIYLILSHIILLLLPLFYLINIITFSLSDSHTSLPPDSSPFVTLRSLFTSHLCSSPSPVHYFPPPLSSLWPPNSGFSV